MEREHCGRWPPTCFPSWGNICAPPVTSGEPAEPQSLSFLCYVKINGLLGSCSQH